METAVTAHKLGARTKKAAIYIVASVMIILMLFPVYWLVLTSLKIGADVSSYPPIFLPSISHTANGRPYAT